MSSLAMITIIAGGSFRGKSIIALNAATKFNFASVISTDMVRNILRTLNPPNRYLSTSTYMMEANGLLMQKKMVSDQIKKLIDIYYGRGEHVIFEGMHFSDDFIEWSAPQDFCKICIDNSLPIKQRIILKSITRRKMRFKFDKDPDYTLDTITSDNVSQSLQLQHASRIEEIHNSIISNCIKNGYIHIKFDDIKTGISKVQHAIKNYFGDRITKR